MKTKKKSVEYLLLYQPPVSFLPDWYIEDKHVAYFLSSRAKKDEFALFEYK